MSTSINKTSHRAVSEGFEFLGIELTPGLIRPSKKSRERVVASVEKTISTSEKGFKAYVETGELDKNLSLLATLQKVSGIMQGWGKHYRFCNDAMCLSHIDARISAMLKGYFATYRNVRQALPESKHWRLLGIEATAQIERAEFMWPTVGKKLQQVENLQIQVVSNPILSS